MVCIHNVTFDEIELGQSAYLTRTLSRADIDLFAAMSGDVNPAHMDEEFAKRNIFHGIIAHGMWGGALISAVLGTELPGPGTIYVEQALRFRRPLFLGDTVTIQVTVMGKVLKSGRVQLDCAVRNQHGRIVIEGSAVVIAPTEKLCIERPEVPFVELRSPGAKALSDMTQDFSLKAQ